MDLLVRIAGFDSIDEMEAAREDRYWDSLTCALNDREFAACYLMGYAIEILVKTAFFRFDGIHAGADLRPSLRVARRHPRFTQPTGLSTIQAHGIHNVRAWGDLLIDARQRAGPARAMDPILAGKLVYELRWVENNWSETLRYRRSIPAAEEIARLLSIADWLRTHYSAFWS